MKNQPGKGKSEAAAERMRQLPYRDAMTTLIAERWGDVWKAMPAALAGDDPEGVHDVRVASRRLRAAMDVAVECFPAAWYRPLHRAAKEITSALGEVRDRDVLLEALGAERAQATATERPGLDRLIERVERERVAARLEMETFMTNLLVGEVPKAVAERFGVSARPPSAAAVDHGVRQDQPA